MTNPFARFVHTSPLSSICHDPEVSLASNAIREYFGPMVQLVADGLHSRGGSSTLPQILHMIQSKSHKKTLTGNAKAQSRTKERNEILKESKLKSVSSREAPSTAAVRAALLVLIQHSIVTFTKTTVHPANTTGIKRKKVVYHYQFHLDRARILPRYPRFVEYTKKALDDTAAALVEEMLIQGRLTSYTKR